MNWDWEKLQEKRQRQPGARPPGPDFNSINEKFKGWRPARLPGGKLIFAVLFLLWLGSGIYIVQPDEQGIVQLFGAYSRTTGPGPHYHLPYPIETVQTPRVTTARRIEIGFRSGSTRSSVLSSQVRMLPEESMMLTGDENVVDVQFIVQYKISNAVDYLFNISQPEKTVKDAAEAAMRKVIGFNKIDSVLTSGKFKIQNSTKELLQKLLNSYKSGIEVMTVQLQDVHPPREVSDAFKDVASAKEDKSRFINEAEAYRNDLIPKTRGEVAAILNKAEAFKQTAINEAQGGSAKFLAVLKEYKKAEKITRKRIYLETMQSILSQPGVSKLILTDKAMQSAVPYLPLDSLTGKGGK